MFMNCRFTPTLTAVISALLMVLALSLGSSAGFGQAPSTFVNPSFFQAGAVLSGYSPIGVQELVAGDFNNDGFQDIVVLDSNANVSPRLFFVGSTHKPFLMGAPQLPMYIKSAKRAACDGALACKPRIDGDL